MYRRFLLVFFMMAGAVLLLWAYWPALAHVPKQDHEAFLAMLAKSRDVPSMIFGHYAFNRSQYSTIADDQLFRPLLHCELGLEQVVLGYHFEAIQALGLVLHVLVSTALGSLLWCFTPGFPAIILSVFFALLLPNVFMVNWSHVHGYMIFTLLILLSLRYLYLSRSEGAGQYRGIMGAALLMSVAVFFYESGVVFSLLMLLYLLWCVRSGPARNIRWLMLMPPALFTVMNAADRLLVHPLHSINHESGIALSRFISWQTALNILKTVKWFFCGGIFLDSSLIGESIRSYVFLSTYSWRWPFDRLTPRLFFGIILIITGLYLLWASRRSVTVRARRPFAALLLFLSIVYVTIIVFGRVNPRGFFSGLLINGYYFYIFWALGLVFMTAWIDMEQVRQRPVWKKLRLLTGILLTGMILINAVSIRDVNVVVAKQQKDEKKFLTYVNGFVHQHRREPDFTFDIDPNCPGNQPYWAPSGTKTQSGFANAYYPGYVNTEHPKYRLACP